MIYPQLHCGFYYYNNKIYVNRQNVLDDMLYSIEMREKEYNIKPDVSINKRNDKAGISYYFNEPVFRMIDWTIEPTQSLKELYVERAKQLRDKYDYLILSYSGGADSHEILYTFLENDLFIDEIQVVHFEKMLNYFPRDVLIHDPAVSQLLEYEFVVLPQLKIVKEKSPNTKITLMDASDFTYEDVGKKKFEFMGMGKYQINSTYLAQTTPYVRNFFQQHNNNKYMVRKNNAGFIRGIEKPQLNIVDNQLLFRFNDISMNSVKLMQQKDIEEMYTIENYFWTPDCPLIPIKQSHVIKKKLESDREFYANFMVNQERIAANQKVKKRQHDNAQNIYRKYDPLLYYYWNKNMFSAPKSNTEVPEFKLLGLVEADHSGMEALNEQNEYYFKRYAKIPEQRWINKPIFTEPYNLGDLNVTWY